MSLPVSDRTKIIKNFRTADTSFSLYDLANMGMALTSTNFFPKWRGWSGVGWGICPRGENVVILQ